MNTMSYFSGSWIGAILDEWNALEILQGARVRGAGGETGEKKKKNLGQSSERGQLVLLAREEVESQGWSVLDGLVSIYRIARFVLTPSIRVRPSSHTPSSWSSIEMRETSSALHSPLPKPRTRPNRGV